MEPEAVERAGRTESAAEERRVAWRAHAAAARARTKAEEWLGLIEGREPVGELESSTPIG